MRRLGFATAWLTTLLGVGLAVAAFLGWITPAVALDLGMSALALLGLWLVIWLPWDLYFAARELIESQRDSVDRGIEVSARDQAGATRLAPRLLALCLGLHLGAAGLLAVVTWATHGSVGYWFAGSFLVSMGLRPLGALYRHLRERIEAMRQRASYPRPDVVSLQARLDEAELRVEALTRDRDALGERLTEVERDARVGQKDLARRYDELVVELERSMAKLTQDRELLLGVKALVRVIKEA